MGLHGLTSRLDEVDTENGMERFFAEIATTSPHSLLALTHRSFSEKFHSHLAKKRGQLQSPKRDDFGSPIFGGTPHVRCGWAAASCRTSCHDGGRGRWCLEWEDETFDPWKMGELADCFGVAMSCVCSIHLYLNLSLYIYTHIHTVYTYLIISVDLLCNLAKTPFKSLFWRSFSHTFHMFFPEQHGKFKRRRSSAAGALLNG